jgi:heat-inducible transcriptional repressor
MNQALTARQTQVLKSLIDEYIDTAEPVGSLSLEKKYSLGISPATIRNEMMNLTKMGYLKQPHTSAGRIPTPIAMKFYISQLMEEKQMSLADEVKTKEEVWDVRKNIDLLLEEATQALADRTNNLAITTLEDGRVYKAGFKNVFESPEFSGDIVACAHIFELLDEAQRIQELFFQKLRGATTIEVLFGEDLGWRNLTPISIVATQFTIGGKKGALGVIGPIRQPFPTIIPIVRYFHEMLESF